MNFKTILVPTDFSEVSGNAVNYAAEIAKLTGAKLILLHAYHIPVVTAEIPVVLPSIDELERDNMIGLRKIQENILQQLGPLNVECVCKCGFAQEEIEQYAKEHDIDLIVMGMQGAGYLSEKLIGSITTVLMQKSKCPVLAIDKQVRFKTIKKIVLACDYQQIENKSVLGPLKEFVRIFKSHVYVLNVVPELEVVPTIDKAIEGVKLEQSLQDINHSYHCIENEDVVEGINDFVIKQQIDMVVMIPHKHSAFKNIFHRSQTKHMAFHTHVPMLSIHE